MEGFSREPSRNTPLSARALYTVLRTFSLVTGSVHSARSWRALAGSLPGTHRYRQEPCIQC